MLLGSDLRMAKSRSDFQLTKENRETIPEIKKEINTMKKGYKEMAAINLALSNLYFEIESEAESYYDRVAECE